MADDGSYSYKVQGRLHSTFTLPIAITLGRLLKKYDVVQCNGIDVYQPEGFDQSLGSASDGWIHLNGFWFSDPIYKLQEAAKVGDRRPQSDIATFHGGMAEPEHVITHEFWHLMAEQAYQRDLKLMSVVRIGYQIALAKPSLAVTGYALANEQEWLAETGAALDMGVTDNEQIEWLSRFIK